jgi:hypothetical protein
MNPELPAMNDPFRDPADQPSKGPLLRHRKQPHDFEKIVLILLAVFAGLMLSLAIFNLTTETGPLANLKALLIAASGTTVAYTVNRLAVTKAAPLWAIGFTWAGIVGGAGILVVGAAMFASTFSGLVLKDVAQRRMQDHGAVLSDYVGARNRASLASARVGPLLTVIAADLAQYVECETKEGCLSGRGGDRGSVAIALDKLAGNAATVAAQFSAGQSAAQTILAGLNTHIADYQKTLGADSDVWLKQGELQQLHARIEQQAGALTEAMPLVLVRSYAGELVAGMTIPGRPEATHKINAILSAHAKSLSEFVAAERGADSAPPAFPGRPGVSDALRYIAEFASLAGIVFVAECVVPMATFSYAYLTLSWRIEQAERGSRPPPPPSTMPPPSNRDDRGGPVRLPPPGTNIHAGQARGRRRRLHGGRR